jgi:hypothetical protein
VAIDEHAERFSRSCPALPDQLSIGRIHLGLPVRRRRVSNRSRKSQSRQLSPSRSA